MIIKQNFPARVRCVETPRCLVTSIGHLRQDFFFNPKTLQHEHKKF